MRIMVGFQDRDRGWISELESGSGFRTGVRSIFGTGVELSFGVEVKC